MSSVQTSQASIEHCVLCANMYLKHYEMSIEKLARYMARNKVLKETYEVEPR